MNGALACVTVRTSFSACDRGGKHSADKPDQPDRPPEARETATSHGSESDSDTPHLARLLSRLLMRSRAAQPGPHEEDHCGDHSGDCYYCGTEIDVPFKESIHRGSPFSDVSCQSPT